MGNISGEWIMIGTDETGPFRDSPQKEIAGICAYCTGSCDLFAGIVGCEFKVSPSGCAVRRIFYADMPGI